MLLLGQQAQQCEQMSADSAFGGNDAECVGEEELAQADSAKPSSVTPGKQKTRSASQLILSQRNFSKLILASWGSRHTSGLSMHSPLGTDSDLGTESDINGSGVAIGGLRLESSEACDALAHREPRNRGCLHTKINQLQDR